MEEGKSPDCFNFIRLTYVALYFPRSLSIIIIIIITLKGHLSIMVAS